MPDKVVTLEFQGQGITGLTAQVNALADAMARLPGGYSLKPQGGGPALPGGGGPAPRTPSPSMPGRRPTNYSNPQQALASASAQLKVSVTAIAQASASGASGMGSLLSAISKLPAPLALATATIGAFAIAAVEGFRMIRAAITPGFQYGLGSVNATSGTFRALGTDNFYGKARSLSDALATNPYARSAAYKAGINPNNSLYSGDLDDPAKAFKWIKYLSSPSVSRDQAMRADRAAGGQFTDEIALLKAASPKVAQMALDERAAKLSPDKLRAAADAQIKLNVALGHFADLALSIGGKLADAINFLADGNESANKVFGPKVVDKNGKIVNASMSNGDEKERMSRDKHTEAMNRFTNAVDGMFGGGSRTRNALPAGWGADQYQRQTYQKAAPMGIL